jgi:predicted PurR-regulated permease PerM
VGFLGASLIGIVEHGVLGSLVRTGIVFGLGELLEGYVLIPKVLGDSLGLHPLVVLFAILAGGAALGMFGILIALPLTASLVILAREFLLPALQQFADEDAPPTTGAGPPGSTARGV